MRELLFALIFFQQLIKISKLFEVLCFFAMKECFLPLQLINQLSYSLLHLWLGIDSYDRRIKHFSKLGIPTDLVRVQAEFVCSLFAKADRQQVLNH